MSQCQGGVTDALAARDDVFKSRMGPRSTQQVRHHALDQSELSILRSPTLQRRRPFAELESSVYTRSIYSKTIFFFFARVKSNCLPGVPVTSCLILAPNKRIVGRAYQISDWRNFYSTTNMLIEYLHN